MSEGTLAPQRLSVSEATLAQQILRSVSVPQGTPPPRSPGHPRLPRSASDVAERPVDSFPSVATSISSTQAHVHALYSMSSANRPASTSSIRLPEAAGMASPALGGGAEAVAPLALGALTRTEQHQLREQEGLVALVLESLASHNDLSSTEASLYFLLWQQLDSPRQTAAQQLLLSSVTWPRNPAAAVEHVRTVIGQNRGYRR